MRSCRRCGASSTKPSGSRPGRIPPQPARHPTSGPEPVPRSSPAQSASPARRVHPWPCSDQRQTHWRNTPRRSHPLRDDVGDIPRSSTSSGTVIPLPAHLRMKAGNRQFRTLNDGLRVRMLPGWVHTSGRGSAWCALDFHHIDPQTKDVAFRCGAPGRGRGFWRSCRHVFSSVRTAMRWSITCVGKAGCSAVGLAHLRSGPRGRGFIPPTRLTGSWRPAVGNWP